MKDVQLYGRFVGVPFQVFQPKFNFVYEQLKDYCSLDYVQVFINKRILRESSSSEDWERKNDVGPIKPNCASHKNTTQNFDKNGNF